MNAQYKVAQTNLEVSRGAFGNVEREECSGALCTVTLELTTLGNVHSGANEPSQANMGIPNANGTLGALLNVDLQDNGTSTASDGTENEVADFNRSNIALVADANTDSWVVDIIEGSTIEEDDTPQFTDNLSTDGNVKS